MGEVIRLYTRRMREDIQRVVDEMNAADGGNVTVQDIIEMERVFRSIRAASEWDRPALYQAAKLRFKDLFFMPDMETSPTK